ncbi:hypothetical protein [Crossiella sp. NPDC003009]
MTVDAADAHNPAVCHHGANAGQAHLFIRVFERTVECVWCSTIKPLHPVLWTGHIPTADQSEPREGP